MDLGLAGKKALVTGGSRGVGRAIVLALAEAGVDVAFSFASNEEAAGETEQAAAALPGSSGRVTGIRADLGNTEETLALYRQAAAPDLFGGPPNILVNNAAVWLSGKATEIPLDDWRRTMAVNMEAPFLLSRQMVRDCDASGLPGKIINITSQAAFMGSTTGHSHYAASKAALVAFTVSLAREAAPGGITVNAVALGLVETDMLAPALAKNREYYEKRIPLGRLAKPEDVSGVVLFLASRLSDYMTGATLDATGGMLMR